MQEQTTENAAKKKKKEKPPKPPKPPKMKFKGHPFLSLLLISIVILLVSFVLCFVSIFVAGFLSAFISNEAAVLIIMGIALILLILIGSFFIKTIVSYDYMLEATYGQARTIWFNLYAFILINVNLFVVLTSLSGPMNWEFIPEELQSLPFTLVASLEEALDFGLIELLTESEYKLYLREGFSGSTFFLFFYALSMIFTFVTFIPLYLEESCLKCGRAFIMNYDFTKITGSYTRAEFEKTSGYWTEKTATVSVPGQSQNATVTYDAYVPGKTEFRGVYKYTDKVSQSHCPICGREKTFHWTSSDRIV